MTLSTREVSSPRRDLARFARLSFGSLFVGNSCFDTRPCDAVTQAHGYKEQGTGLSDIKQIGNDYNRNRIGPAKSFSAGGQMPISPEVKSKLKAVANDADMPDSARRVLREYLSR